jgi:hypothetical protein
MTEAEFWSKIRKRMPRGVFARRIEDSSGNLGTFDTFVACDGRSAWMELKAAGPNAKPDLRPGQASFAAQCFDAGIPAAYLVGSPNGVVRMIGPGTTGDDWRQHLVARWDHLDVPAILKELMVGMEQWYGRQSEPVSKDTVFLGSTALQAWRSPTGQVQGSAYGR